MHFLEKKPWSVVFIKFDGIMCEISLREANLRKKLVLNTNNALKGQ